MYSLNVPVPASVARLAADLAGETPTARARRRGSHTLVAKRLDAPSGPDAAHRLEARLRDALAGTPPFEARVDWLDTFTDPPAGPAPVLYLRVTSPGLLALHERLCDRFEPVDGLEGDAYVPHVTVARGGSADVAADLAGREVDPIGWTVDGLDFYDAERELPVTSFGLAV